MTLTLKEIFKMIDEKKLHYDISTQRGFIYNDQTLKIGMTKAGLVINSILEKKFTLPAVYFWNIGNGQYDLQDGKQRLLSCYSFYRNTGVQTKINGQAYSNWESLDEVNPELAKEFLNYTFEVVVSGDGTNDPIDVEKKEKSFEIINTSAVPLTEYEVLRALNYGKFIDGFEDKIKVLNQFGKIVVCKRGENYLSYLSLICGIFENYPEINSRTRLSTYDIIKHDISNLRNNDFNEFADKQKFTEKMRFLSLILMNTSIRLSLSALIIKFLFEQHIGNDKIEEILGYYKECFNNPNDISSWKIQTHKVFIKKYLYENKKLDPLRKFNKYDIDEMWSDNKLCKKCGKPIAADMKTGDHIVAWSQGGRTKTSNLQILCKSCNSSKGADEDGEE